MKSGIIDIFADAIGWVMGKAGLFVLAVILGIAIAVTGMFAGSAAAQASFGFQASPKVVAYVWIGALLPQVIVLFWLGMIFIRAESISARHIVQAAAIQCAVTLIFFHRALPEGFTATFVAWSVAAAGIAGLAWVVRRLVVRQSDRAEAYLEQLLEENAQRRVDLKTRYGTDSASARELGLP